MLKEYFKILLKKTPLLFRVYVYYLRSKLYALLYKKWYGVKLVRDLNFQDYKKSDTLFILGSGRSVNDFSDKEWKHIGNSDSFGFNFWAIHDFVPTFYCFEIGSIVNERKKITQIKTLDFKKSAYHSVPFILKDVCGGLQLEKIPGELRKKLYLSVDIVTPGDTICDFRKNLNCLIKKGFFRKNNTELLFRMRATVSYLVMLGYVAGYKNIVLCGVDLHHPIYFYEENSEYYKRKGLEIPETGQTGNIHDTADKKYGVTIDEIIYTIDELLLKPNGVNLYIGSKKSLLYPKLPYYFDGKSLP